MNKKFLISAIICAVLLVVLSVSCFAAAPSSDYELLINDEFEGSALNTDIWAYRTGSSSGGNNKIENVRVQDGKLYFDYVYKDGTFTCAGVISLDNLSYGYYETKAKSFQGVNGFHTSFWTSGNAGNAKGLYHPKNNRIMEIDGFEMDSNETDVAPVPYYNLHYWWTDHKGIGGNRFNIESDGDASTPDWFTVGFEWLPGLIIYYANGEEIGRNETTVYGMTHAKLTSLAMPDKYLQSDGTYDIDTSKADENGYIGSSEYEYFTYYQKRLKNVNLLGNGHFEFNRQNGSEPQNFYYEGDAQIKFNPFAYEGYCSAVLTDEARLGQYIAYLLDGNYTLDGYFKTTENTAARLVVYDKDGTELKSLSLPECSDWTYISMADVKIEDSAFAVVEVTSGQVWIDNLAFYCQEGDDSYINYKDSDYNNYPVLKTTASYVTLAREDAEKSDHSWKSSSAASVENYYVYTSANPLADNYYKNIWAKYTINIEETGYHDLELMRILYNNNPPSQTYTITLDGESVCDPVTVTTYAEDPSADWIKLCTLYAKQGQVITVTMTCDAFTSGSLKCTRVLPILLAPHSKKLIGTAIIAQIGNPTYQHCHAPYAFDKSDSEICPITSNGEIYIPYQPIKDILSLTDVPDDAEYVSVSQIEESETFNVKENGNIIIIYNSTYAADDSVFSTAYKSLNTFRILNPQKSMKALYVGTASKPGEEVYGVDSCILTKNWGKSSLGHNSSSLYTSATGAEALWLVKPNNAHTYSLQIYSVVHNGENSSSSPSTTSAGVDVILGNDAYSYTLNQCNGTQGWYDLGDFELTENDIVEINLYNIANDGHLRASAVRLVPKAKEPMFVGYFDIANQEITDYNSATKTGSWRGPSAGVLNDCYYSGSSNASVTWTLTPSASQKYSIQLFSACYESNGTPDGTVTLTVDGTKVTFDLNQKKTSETHMGWYQLGTYDLTPSSQVTITINRGTSGYLRAKSVRLVPLAEEPSATKSGSVIILNTGTLSNSSSAVLYRECEPSGSIAKIVYFENPGAFLNIPMENAENSSKLFFWNDVLSMVPIRAALELD